MHTDNTGHFPASADGCPIAGSVNTRQTPEPFALDPISFVYLWIFNCGWMSIQISDLFVHPIIYRPLLCGHN